MEIINLDTEKRTTLVKQGLQSRLRRVSLKVEDWKCVKEEVRIWVAADSG